MPSLADLIARRGAAVLRRTHGERSDSGELSDRALVLVDPDRQHYPFAASIGQLQISDEGGGGFDAAAEWKGPRVACEVTIHGPHPRVSSQWEAVVPRYGEGRWCLETIESMPHTLHLTLSREPTEKIQRRGYE